MTHKYITMKTKTKNQMKSVTINMPLKEYNKINKLIEEGNYLNVSDFCRTAIRKELENKEKYF